MQTCQNCGTTNPDGQKFCTTCGAPLPANNPRNSQGYNAQPQYQQSQYQQSQYQQNPYQQGQYQQNPYQSSAYYPTAAQQKPADYPIGGLLAWSVFTILVCRILGFIALFTALGINKCATAEDQQKKITTTKTLCLVGTVVGLIVTVAYMVLRVRYN